MRLSSLTQISPKCYKAVAFDGSEALIPSSQFFGQDNSVSKSDAYWISAWILGKKDLQYSAKKEAWFDEKGNMLPTYHVHKHVPEKVEPVEKAADETLIR